MRPVKIKKLVKTNWINQNDFLKYDNENYFRNMHDDTENWTVFKNNEEGD